MSNGLLLQLRLDQVRSLRDTLESWRERHVAAEDCDGDLAEVVRLPTELVRDLERLYAAEYERAVRDAARSLAVLRATRASLAEAFRLSAQAIALLREVVTAAEQRIGQALEGHQGLKEAQSTLEGLRIRLDREWPVGAPEDTAQARGELARGETLELEEAFAGMAGISREELRQRVEEHKHRRQALGME